MPPKGLIKLTAAANNLEAWRDWQRVAQVAIELGRHDLVLKLVPPPDAGWRKVDKARHKLEEAIGEK